MFTSNRDGRGGGVAIFVKSTLKTEVYKVDDSNWLKPHSLECICIKVQYNYHQSFMICCLYRTLHVSNDLNNITCLLESLNSTKRATIVTGDINFNLLDIKGSKIVMRAFSKLNFTQLVCTATRGQSLLDPVLINSLDSHKISQMKVSDEGISDHSFVSFGYTVSKQKLKRKRVEFRDFKNTDWSSFINYVVNESTKANHPSSCDDTCDAVISIVNEGLEKFVPRKIVFESTKKCKFAISGRSKRLLSIKNYFAKLYSTTSSARAKIKRNEYTKRVSASIRKDFKDAGDNLVKKHGVWAAQRKSNILFKKSCKLDSNVDPNEINKYYCEMGFPSGTLPNDTMADYVSPKCPTRFKVKAISSVEVFKAWKSIRKTSDHSQDVTGVS